MTMPWHRELGADLCAYDAVAFQTPTIATTFSTTPQRELGAQPLDGDWLRLGARGRRGPGLPIGIDVKEFERLTASAEAGGSTRRCTARWPSAR